MKIGWRIAAAFTVVLIGFALICAIIYNNTRELIATNAWVVLTQAALEQTANVLRSINRAEASMLGYVNTNDPSRVRDLETATARMTDAARDVQVLTRDNAKQQRRLFALQEQLARYTTTLNELTLNTATSGETAWRDYRDGLDQIRTTITAIEDEERRLLNERTRRAEATASYSLDLIVWGGMDLMLVCIFVGVLLGKTIMTPVKSLQRGAAELGAGNLQYRIATKSTDELGELAEAFDAMAANLSRTMVAATTEAQAELASSG